MFTVPLPLRRWFEPSPAVLAEREATARQHFWDAVKQYPSAQPIPRALVYAIIEGRIDNRPWTDRIADAYRVWEQYLSPDVRQRHARERRHALGSLTPRRETVH